MKSKYYEWTKELIEQGYNYAEIAKAQGRDSHNVRKFCLRAGLTQPSTGKDTIKKNAQLKLAEQVDEKGYELIDCIGGVDGIIHIKCKICGAVLERKGQVARRTYKILCENCRRLRHEEEEKERLQRKHQKEEHRKRIAYKQQSFLVCPECGGLFYDESGRRKYCSEKCALRVMSRNNETRRRARAKEHPFDKGITLYYLYVRDKGKCYMCGRECDWNDSYYKGNVFIAGDTYPSIEHIVPLSKGGAHTWENIKLACRKCNYMKSDSLPRLQK